MGKYSAPVSVLVVIGISIAITLGCSVIGMVQGKLFDLIGINRLCEKLGYRLGKLRIKIEKHFI